MVALFLVARLVLATTVPLSGTVEDALGRPVAGAMVWLGDTITTHHGPEVLASGLTDEKGAF
jgi:hypothetical protein